MAAVRHREMRRRRWQPAGDAQLDPGGPSDAGEDRHRCPQPSHRPAGGRGEHPRRPRAQLSSWPRSSRVKEAAVDADNRTAAAAATPHDVHLRHRRSLARHRPGALESAAAARRRHCAAANPAERRTARCRTIFRGYGPSRRSDRAGVGFSAGRTRRGERRKIDLVFNVAGVLHDAAQKKGPERALREIDAEWMMHVYAVNAVGPVLCTQALAPRSPRARSSPTCRRASARLATTASADGGATGCRRRRSTWRPRTWRTSCGARTCPRWRSTPARRSRALPTVPEEREAEPAADRRADGGDAPRGRRRPHAGGQRRLRVRRAGSSGR